MKQLIIVQAYRIHLTGAVFDRWRRGGCVATLDAMVICSTAA